MTARNTAATTHHRRRIAAMALRSGAARSPESSDERSSSVESPYSLIGPLPRKDDEEVRDRQHGGYCGPQEAESPARETRPGRGRGQNVRVWGGGARRA